MKIRNGFVSNSSSSSFIVAFKAVPKTYKALQKMLFDDELTYTGDYSSQHYSTQDIAVRVFEDMKNQNKWVGDEQDVPAGPLTKKQVKAAVDENGDGEGERFLKANPKAKFFIFDYSDNDGELGSAMEHGTLFHRLPYVQISHH